MLTLNFTFLILFLQIQVSQKSDIYSLCLVAFEFVLRSTNSRRFLLLDSHFNNNLVVDSLIINLISDEPSTNYDHRPSLADQDEEWIWTNDLIGTLKVFNFLSKIIHTVRCKSLCACTLQAYKSLYLWKKRDLN